MRKLKRKSASERVNKISVAEIQILIAFMLMLVMKHFC
jgi:hypothetical protein